MKGNVNKVGKLGQAGINVSVRSANVRSQKLFVRTTAI